MGTVRRSLFELDKILGGLKSHFMYTDSLNKRIIDMLNQNALSHSNKLEPDCGRQETLERLTEAWDFAVKEFDGGFTNHFIKEVCSRVSPQHAVYRDSQARLEKLNGGVQLTTNPAKLVREMEKLFRHMDESENHPALRATEFNLYGMIIHPFADGNGRTFRLLQNLFLYHNGIPPATIRSSERMTYIRHCEDAREGFRTRGGQDSMFSGRSCEEHRFFEYNLDKIKSAAVKLNDEIAAQQRYQIKVDLKGDANSLKSVRNRVQDSLNAYGSASRIRAYVSKGELQVVTSASEEYIIGVFEKNKRNLGVKKYKIKCTTRKKD